jgi:hypothetical protein
VKKRLVYFYLLASFLGMGQAIKFGRLGTGFNNDYVTPVRALFYDTLDKKLYAGGQFTKADGKTVWGAAVWYNNSWDSLRGGLAQFRQQSPGPSEGSYSSWAWKIIRYKNKIYYAGPINWVNGKNQYNLGVWNGSDWDYPISEPPNGEIFDLKVDNNILYACGMFTKFGNTTCNYVAKFDGASWQPVGDFSKYFKSVQPPATMQAIEIYENEIYVGGEFDDSTGTTRNIAKFDGTNWVNVGTGIQQGGVNCVFALQEFNNKLYIGGRFGKTQDIPGNSFVLWDGNNYKQISSSGLSDGDYITAFKKHKDKLFVTGKFLKYGPFTAIGLFYIDSLQQCAITGLQSTYENPENTYWEPIEFMGDSLILGGLFKYLDTVRANSIGVITNYDSSPNCLTTNLQENYLAKSLINVFPNPVTNKLNVEFNFVVPEVSNLLIYNYQGEVVYRLDKIQQKQEIDFSYLSHGIYLLKIYGISLQQVIKIVKE